jgi:hypothetical protein
MFKAEDGVIELQLEEGMAVRTIHDIIIVCTKLPKFSELAFH